MTEVPKCKKCGHPPCPGCETWCDIIADHIFCPSCNESTALYNHDRDKDGDVQECGSCEISFKLDFDEHVDFELCCDSECEYDMPMEDVLAWCAEARDGPVMRIVGSALRSD